MEGGKYVSLNGAEAGNKEHMFGFMAGFEQSEIQTLLLDRLTRWQDIVKDHLRTSAALTPRLLIAMVLAQFGLTVTEDVIKVAYTLKTCDRDLEDAMRHLNSDEDCIERVTSRIRSLNKNLIDMNVDLTGTRSTMHYLADSAKFLVNRYSTYDDYVTARLSEWIEDDAKKKGLAESFTSIRHLQGVDARRRQIGNCAENDASV